MMRHCFPVGEPGIIPTVFRPLQTTAAGYFPSTLLPVVK